MSDNHFADVGKKDGMSLNLALIVLDRLNTSERIDVARDNLAEAVKVAKTAINKQIPMKPKAEGLDDMDNYLCPECKATIGSIDDYFGCNKINKFCFNCGQALDWGKNQ